MVTPLLPRAERAEVREQSPFFARAFSWTKESGKRRRGEGKLKKL
jgi:hypothetical protein